MRAHYGVRSDRYKLARFYGDMDYYEFYDLQADPREMNNRIDDPAYQDEIARMKAELTRLRREYGDNAPRAKTS